MFQRPGRHCPIHEHVRVIRDNMRVVVDAFEEELRVTSGRLTHAFHAKLTWAGSGVRSTNGESNAGALVPQDLPYPRGFNPGPNYHR